jgi:hypothetical protein
MLQLVRQCLSYCPGCFITLSLSLFLLSLFCLFLFFRWFHWALTAVLVSFISSFSVGLLFLSSLASTCDSISFSLFRGVTFLGKIYLWIGKKSNPNEKKESTNYAVQYLSQHGLPNNTQIERVSEGNETSSFKAEFSLWDAPTSFGMKSSSGVAKSGGNDEPVDIKAVLQRKEAEETPIDDGKGKLQIWVIKDFNKEPVPQANYGEFYAGT